MSTSNVNEFGLIKKIYIQYETTFTLLNKSSFITHVNATYIKNGHIKGNVSCN